MSGYTNLFGVTDLDIRGLLYLPDDRKIAAYLSISVERVAKVRAAAPNSEIERRDVHDTSKPVYDPARATAIQSAESCTAHLRALLRYGLKYDGLPGLTAEDFYARCRENDVAVPR